MSFNISSLVAFSGVHVLVCRIVPHSQVFSAVILELRTAQLKKHEEVLYNGRVERVPVPQPRSSFPSAVDAERRAWTASLDCATRYLISFVLPYNGIH